MQFLCQSDHDDNYDDYNVCMYVCMYVMQVLRQSAADIFSAHSVTCQVCMIGADDDDYDDDYDDDDDDDDDDDGHVGDARSCRTRVNFIVIMEACPGLPPQHWMV